MNVSERCVCILKDSPKNLDAISSAGHNGLHIRSQVSQVFMAAMLKLVFFTSRSKYMYGIHEIYPTCAYMCRKKDQRPYNGFYGLIAYYILLLRAV